MHVFASLSQGFPCRALQCCCIFPGYLLFLFCFRDSLTFLRTFSCSFIDLPICNQKSSFSQSIPFSGASSINCIQYVLKFQFLIFQVEGWLVISLPFSAHRQVFSGSSLHSLIGFCSTFTCYFSCCSRTIAVFDCLCVSWSSFLIPEWCGTCHTPSLARSQSS